MQTQSRESIASDLTQIKRLVIRAPNWLGDAVMALPAMGALRAALPDAKIAVAAIPSIAPLFAEGTNAAQNELLTLDGVRREPTTLKEGTFDAAVLLPNSFRSAWVARGARIPERWGFSGNVRGWMLTKSVARPRERVHQSTWYLELVRGLGFEAPSAMPRVTVRVETARRAAALLQKHGAESGAPLVGVAPGAAYGHAKRWPPTRMVDLLRRLLAERGATCVLVGAPGDAETGREIELQLPIEPRVINVIGRTDLRVFAGVLAACDAFVSNDSGAMHLAAAVGVPVTAIFGPTDERVTAPLGDHDVLVHKVFCRPCMLRDCPIDHRCMKGITVDAVFESVSRRLLQGRGADDGANCD
jgi:heptosyltransferase-2